MSRRGSRIERLYVTIGWLTPRHYIAVFANLFIAIFIAYGRALNSPFLYDDYTHIADARDATLTTILAGFGPLKNQPGLFFRPFALMSYWLSFLVVGVGSPSQELLVCSPC